uniref:Proepiregulin n=1 Tax=Athene cunicularia TaxID=194338 RepID=A0A663MSS4_ATHCN
QAVLGTTVIPLCGPGEMENCTTALIQTENSPRVAQVGITRCKPEMKDYCFHGQCVYIVDLDEHYCRCDVGFSGVRCVHSELVRQPLSKEYVALTVIVVLLFLTAISIASYYICRRSRQRAKEEQPPEGVLSFTELDGNYWNASSLPKDSMACHLKQRMA